MLVCNVSLLARRAVIAASVAEHVTAADALATGNVVFATLVDDPASVGDFVDAYLGQIMREAASAAASVDATLPVLSAAMVEAGLAVDSVNAVLTTLHAAVIEAVSAADLPDALIIFVASILAEAATATDLPDASTTSAASSFNGALALDGPIPPSTSPPTVIYIEG